MSDLGYDLDGYDSYHSPVPGQSTGIDIITKLTDEGFGTPGADLFLGFMPDSLRDGVVVMESGGASPLETYGSDDDHTRPSFQILIRDSQYGRGKTKADRIMRLFMTIANEVVGNTYYQYIFPTSDVISLGKVAVLDGETNEFSTNFSTIRDV